MFLKYTFSEYALWFVTLVVLAITVAYPLVMLFYSSVVEDHKVTFAAFQRMLSDPFLPKVTINTIQLAVLVTILSIIIGVPLAWLVVRTDLPIRNIIRVLATLPFIFPPYLLAMGWISLADPSIGIINRLYRALGGHGALVNIYSFWGLVIVMASRFYVYVFLTTASALEQMDPSLEEAARMCGAPLSRVAREITIPLITPSIVAGALLAFVATISNFGIPALIGLPAHYAVLTTVIYSDINMYDLEGAAAYSMLLLAISLPLLIIERFIARGRRYTTITGRATRPTVMRLGGAKYPLLIAVIAFLIPTTIFPLATLVMMAFLKECYLNPFDIRNYSFKNLYEVIFVNPDTQTAIQDSLLLATSSATAIALFGALIAYIVLRTQMAGRTIINVLASAPFALPGSVLALAMIFAFIKTPIFNTLTLLFIAYFSRYLSYGVRTCVGALLQIDPTLEEAARISGAPWIRTFSDIVIPLIKAGIVSSWILVFMPTLSELTVSVILAPPTQPTIGKAVYDLMESGQFGWAYALGFIVMIVVILGQIAINFVSKKLGVKAV